MIGIFPSWSFGTESPLPARFFPGNSPRSDTPNLSWYKILYLRCCQLSLVFCHTSPDIWPAFRTSYLFSFFNNRFLHYQTMHWQLRGCFNPTFFWSRPPVIIHFTQAAQKTSSSSSVRMIWVDKDSFNLQKTEFGEVFHSKLWCFINKSLCVLELLWHVWHLNWNQVRIHSLVTSLGTPIQQLVNMNI